MTAFSVYFSLYFPTSLSLSLCIPTVIYPEGFSCVSFGVLFGLVWSGLVWSGLVWSGWALDMGETRMRLSDEYVDYYIRTHLFVIFGSAGGGVGL